MIVLQVLVRGFRGLFERKAFFNKHPLALTNLKWFINNQSMDLIT
jgi:hypothetical protein